MKTYTRIKTKLLLPILISAFVFTNCIDDEYDLSSGINTEMSVGGDSLSFPIIKTTKIYLDSMMNSQDIEMLRRMADSTYSFQLLDSMKASLGTLSPITISVPAMSIPPMSLSFADMDLPSFNLDPVTFETKIETPNFDLENLVINPINTTYSQTFPIETVLSQSNSKRQKAKAETSVIGPFQKTVNQSINESLFVLYPKELKKINKIFFKNTKVTLTFDKTNTNLLNLTSHSDTIKEFRIDFPTDYALSTPTGLNSRIEGSSFVIKNAVLTKGVNIFTASFVIESLDVSNIFQYGSLNYNKPINYSINYGFKGETNDISLLLGKEVEYKVSLKTTPVINDIEIVTNTFTSSDVQTGSYTISKLVQNIPSEISEIKSVSFANNANLQISIPDPGFYPFTFTAGNCQIELPKSIIFKPATGLNTTTNVLTIPYNQIFGTKTLEISGLDINKTIPEGQNSFTFTDQIKYTISGVAIGSQTTTLNNISAMNNKKVIISGTCKGLTPENAELKTRRITIDLAKNTSSIKINKFVSKDVKRLYSADLKTPSDITFKINIDNFPGTIDSIFFDNYVIQLPEYLKFKEGNVNSKNQVILNRGFKVSEGFTKTLTLEKLDFGVNGKILENGTFVLNDEVSMQGKIFIKSSSLNTSELDNIKIIPTVKINDLALSVIEGEITPVIPPKTKIMMLNFPDYLKQETTRLDLQNPVVTLQVGNTLGIAIHATVTMIPKRNGQVIEGATVSGELEIPAAKIIGQTSWYQYWIARTDAGISADYQPIVIPDISNLLNSVPDEVDIVVSPSLLGDRQIIDLYSTNNTLEMNYSLNIPLDFGTEFNICYTDTLISLKEKLQEIIKYTRQVDVMAIVDNKIPLDMNFNVVPLDSLKREISGISIESADSIKSCNIDGSVQRNYLNLKISETSEGALDNLDAFAFKISAFKNSTIAGMPLKTDQYISLEIRVRIPDGLTINQN